MDMMIGFLAGAMCITVLATWNREHQLKTASEKQLEGFLVEKKKQRIMCEQATTRAKEEVEKIGQSSITT